MAAPAGPRRIRPGIAEAAPTIARPLAASRPIRLLEVELGAPLPDLDLLHPETGFRYEQARLLVRLLGSELGFVDLASSSVEVPAAAYAPLIWGSLGTAINQHRAADGETPVSALDPNGLVATNPPSCVQERTRFLEAAPFVSVVVPTRDRPDALARCLSFLLAQRYPPFEFIVLDNGATSSATEQMITLRYGDEPRIRCVRDSDGGLSRARNHALRLTQAEFIAFCDDDVVLDPDWLAGLLQGFTRGNNVGCVTGAVVPWEAETAAQIWFEYYGGFHKGFAPQLYDLGTHRIPDPLYPYTAGRFGTGASMAFRTEVLRALGGFDEALGAGTPARGGEDLAVFFDVVTHGYQLAYEPGALAYHAHRGSYKELQAQLFGYGVGLTAYLARALVTQPRRVLELVTKLPSGLWYAFSPRSPKNARKLSDYPADLSRREWRGMLCGPGAYLQRRWFGRG